MPSIFISHANSDTDLIAPFVQALEATEGIDVFADRPDKFERALDRPGGLAEADRIQMAESWQEGIKRGLDTHDLVLLFWTRRSVDHLDTRAGFILASEIIIALREGKLRCVLLAEQPSDAPAIAKDRPTMLSDPQYLDLSHCDRSSPETVAADSVFRELVRQLRLPRAGPARVTRRSIRPFVRAKLVDRVWPIRELKAAAIATLRCHGQSAESRQSRGLIVIGHHEHMLELIDERFYYFDGFDCVLPKGLDRATPRAGADDPVWKRFAFKGEGFATPSVEGFAEFLRGEFDRLSDKIAERVSSEPVAFLAKLELSEAEIGADPEGFFETWVRAWEDRLARPFRAPVVPLLYITFAEGWADQLRRLVSLGREARLAEAALSAIERVGPERVEIVTSTDLAKIGFREAREWRDDYFENEEADALLDLLHELYPKRHATPARYMSQVFTSLRSHRMFDQTRGPAAGRSGREA